MSYEGKMVFATCKVRTVSHQHQRGCSEKGGALFYLLTLEICFCIYNLTFAFYILGILKK